MYGVPKKDARVDTSVLADKVRVDGSAILQKWKC